MLRTIYQNDFTTVRGDIDHYVKIIESLEGDREGYIKESVKERHLELKHLLEGKRIKNKEGKEYIINKVNLNFHWGHYFSILISDKDGSLGIKFIENVSCEKPEILNPIKKFQDDYKYIL